MRKIIIGLALVLVFISVNQALAGQMILYSPANFIGKVTLYKHANFRGPAVVFFIDGRNFYDRLQSIKGTGLHDEASSISWRLNPGVSVTLYEHTDGGGRVLVLWGSGDNANIHYDGMGDKISAWKWFTCPPSARLYGALPCRPYFNKPPYPLCDNRNRGIWRKPRF